VAKHPVGGFFLGVSPPDPRGSRFALDTNPPPHHPTDTIPRRQGFNFDVFLVILMKIKKFIFVRRGAEPPAWGVLTLARTRGRPPILVFVFAEVRNIV
jgi:hypothetical protein